MRTLILVVLGVVSGAAYAAPLQCPTSPGGTFALPTVVTVPTCPAGQVLTGNGSTLSCVTASVDASQPATGSTLGGIELNTDLGGTATAPQVTATHLAAPLPFAQGGLGGSPACVAGQYLTCSAGGCVCSTVPLSIVTGAPACGTEPVIANGTTWTCSTVQSQVNTQAASISNIETSIAALQSTVAPTATPTTLGLMQVSGDLTNTAYSPQVKSTHLLAPLPLAQGGTGVGALTCAAGQHLTSNGTTYLCTVDSVTSLPDATSTVTGGTRLTNDLGGTASAPTVTSTHLSSALPQTQGGTGAGALTCSSGQHLTSNGSAYSCSADSVTPDATATVSGVARLTNDLGGTATAPTVTGTHLSAPLPQAQGGTGAAALTCASGEHLTSNGSVYSCTADSGTSYTGVTSDGSNGLTIVGAVDIGTGSATRLGITPLTVAQLLALSDMVTWDMAYVSDGASASDCATGGGTYSHWCHYTGSAWATDAVEASSSALIAALPTFDPVAGTYNGTQSVTLSGPSGAAICYSTDGVTIPAGVDGTCTTGSTYSGAISVAASSTLKAVATKVALLTSPIASAAYTINTGIAYAAGTGLNTVTARESGTPTQPLTYSVTDTNSTVFVAACNGQVESGTDPTVTPPTISGGALTWTRLATSWSPAAKRTCVLFTATSAAAVSSETVTVSWDNSTYLWGAASVIAFKGVGSLGTPVAAYNDSTGTAANFVSVTTTAASEAWVLGFGFATTTGGTYTYTADTTEVSHVAPDTNALFWVGVKEPVGVGTYTLGITGTGNTSLDIGLELKP